MYTYIHISPPSYASLSSSLPHPSRWSQSTELIPLCYAAASHQLCILHLVVYICQCYSLTSSQLPVLPPRFLFSLPMSSSPFSTSASLFLSCPQVHQNHFFFQIPYICVSKQYLVFFKFISFIYLFLAALGLRYCAQAFLVAASGGYSSLRCAGFSFRWLLLLQSMGSRRAGFSSCGTRAQQLWLAGTGSVAVARGLSCSAACGIFPGQGSNPCPVLAGGFSTTVPPGKRMFFSF